MTATKSKHGKLTNSGPNILSIVVLGIVLGYIFQADFAACDKCMLPLTSTGLAYGLGLLWAFLVLEWIKILQRRLAFKADPLPAELKLDSKEDIKKQLSAITGNGSLANRAYNLLTMLMQNTTPAQITDMAAAQSRRARSDTAAGTAFMILMFIFCALLGSDTPLIWTAGAVVAITLYVRNNLRARADRYVETNLLARLPSLLPGTGINAAELGAILGQAVDQAFKKHFPQPEQIGLAVSGCLKPVQQQLAEQADKTDSAFARLGQQLEQTTSELPAKLKSSTEALQASLSEYPQQLSAIVGPAIEEAVKGTAAELQKVQESFAETHKSLLAERAKTEGESAEQLRETQAAIRALTDGLAAQFETASGKLEAAATSQASSLEAALGKVGPAIEEGVGAGAAEMRAALEKHSSNFESATGTLAGQLEKIQVLEKDIQKILHVQEVVDETIKSVAAAEEFNATLVALRTHLEQSDKLLAEVAKPRTIRLVEADGEIAGIDSE